MGEQSGRTPFRVRVQEMLRAAILDAAAARASRVPWSEVRISDIADDVGISRQTIHHEFGTKEDLANALFGREMLTFQTALIEVIEAAPDLDSAIRDALNWLLDAATEHPMLDRMLAYSRDGVDQSLLPLLTVHVDRLVLPLRRLLTEVFDRRWPGTDPVRSELVVDVVVRWAITQIIMPSDFGRDVAVDHLVRMTTSFLRIDRGVVVPESRAPR